MKTRRGLIFVWMKNGAWIDQNWQKLQSLCLQEAVDAEVEKPFVEAGDVFAYTRTFRSCNGKRSLKKSVAKCAFVRS